MSPRRSVFDEQLKEIETRKPRTPFWERPMGCLILGSLLCGGLLGGAGTYMWTHRDEIFGEGGSLERLVDEGRELSRTPPRETLENLRERVAAIQGKWEEMSESGELRQRLESLREDLAGKRDRASETTREAWGDLLGKSEALLKQAREKAAAAPGELDEILETIGWLEKKTPDDEGSGKEDEGTSRTVRRRRSSRSGESPQDQYSVGP